LCCLAGFFKSFIFHLVYIPHYLSAFFKQYLLKALDFGNG